MKVNFFFFLTVEILFTVLAFSRFKPSKTSRLAKFASFSLNGTARGGPQMKVQSQKTDSRVLLNIDLGFATTMWCGNL